MKLVDLKVGDKVEFLFFKNFTKRPKPTVMTASSLQNVLKSLTDSDLVKVIRKDVVIFGGGK